MSLIKTTMSLLFRVCTKRTSQCNAVLYYSIYNRICRFQSHSSKKAPVWFKTCYINCWICSEHSLATTGEKKQKTHNLSSLTSHGTDWRFSIMDDNQCHEMNHDEAHTWNTGLIFSYLPANPNTYTDLWSIQVKYHIDYCDQTVAVRQDVCVCVCVLMCMSSPKGPVNTREEAPLRLWPTAQDVPSMPWAPWRIQEVTQDTPLSFWPFE